MAEIKYKHLFEPITINGVEIKNRIAMAPMCNGYGSPEGQVTEQYKAYYARRARGGVGIIWAGPVVTLDRISKGHCNKPLGLYNASHLTGHCEMAEIIHYFGAKCILQMGSGASRQGKMTQQSDSSMWPIAASPVPLSLSPEHRPKKAVEWYAKKGLHEVMADYILGPTPREATVEEIEEQENSYAITAELARHVGYDGAEIHQAHGYFGFTFLSPRLNKRTDHYGGSLENRSRFFRNSLIKTRKRVGSDFLIGVRLSLEEHIEGGLTLDETIKVCKELEYYHADYILLSDGCYEAFEYFVPNEDGHCLEGAAKLKKAVKIPVITPSVHDPEMAEDAIKNSKTDMVALGRQLLADPDTPDKWREGEKFKKCLRCNLGCMRRLLEEGLPIRCEINPELGYEQYDPANFPQQPFRRAWHYGGKKEFEWACKTSAE